MKGLHFTRRELLGAALATGSIALPPRLAFAAPQIGVAAPDFELPDQDGAMRKLSSYRGKTVVLEWTNHDCPYVRKHYNSANMQTLQKEAAGKGIVWLSVASSPKGEQGHVTGPEAKALTVSRNAAPAAVLLDHASKAARLYQAVTTPHMFVIDPAGTLRYMGAIDSNRSTRTEDVAKAEPFLRSAMLAVAAGGTPEKAVTSPYGCTIKYGA
jgi:peroxiredoxin